MSTVVKFPAPVPSVQSLYDLAQAEGLFPKATRSSFDDVPHVLLWAAVDPASYEAFAHLMLDRTKVTPKNLRRFDHSFILKMVKEKVCPKPDPNGDDI